MGTFFAEVSLASPRQPDRKEPLKLLVDTGSTYTWVSATFLQRLGLQPIERRRDLTIEGKSVERPAAEVLMTLEGRTLHTVCLFGEGGDLEVLGAYTLEGFGLTVDPVQRRLVPAILYGAWPRRAATPTARGESLSRQAWNQAGRPTSRDLPPGH